MFNAITSGTNVFIVAIFILFVLLMLNVFDLNGTDYIFMVIPIIVVALVNTWLSIKAIKKEKGNEDKIRLAFAILSFIISLLLPLIFILALLLPVH